jgi:hypothetical protein
LLHQIHQKIAVIHSVKDALAKAGVIIKEENGVISARNTKVNWDKYRAEKN